MEKYLTKLYQKPDHHKKQFAFLASGTITLLIFGFWSLTTFGINNESNDNEANVAAAPETVEEVGPLQSFKTSLASSWEAIRDNFVELKSGIDQVDFEAEYEEMKGGALNNYGQ